MTALVEASAEPLASLRAKGAWGAKQAVAARAGVEPELSAQRVSLETENASAALHWCQRRRVGGKELPVLLRGDCPPGQQD